MKARKYISDMQKELQTAGAKCGNLRSQLNYIKMMYHQVHPEFGLGSDQLSSYERTDDSLSEKVSSPTREDIDRIVESISGDRSTTCSQEYPSAFDDSTGSLRISPRIDYVQNDILSDSSVLDNLRVEAVDLSMTDTKDSEMMSHTPRTFIFSQSNEASPRPGENMPQGTGEQFLGQESPTDYWQEAQQHLLALPLNESLKDKVVASPKSQKRGYNTPVNISIPRNNGNLTSRSTRKDEKKDNISVSLTPCKKVPAAKTDDTLTFKIRRKKGKLRNSASRSTVATRDTSYVKKKDSRKKRLNNLTAKGRKNSDAKPSSTCNEVVEIFNNTQAQNPSNSVISGKRSKFGRNPDHASSTSVFVSDYGATQQKAKYLANTTPHDTEMKNEKWVVNDEKVETQTVTTTLPGNQSGSRCQHAVVQTAYYNSGHYRNYEMPTLASNLKKVDRSYFSRFHFRNIPFVVGTSVTPSHNLGLNIQQVLSILKTKQPATSGAAPFLIRKVSRGMEPISVLMERMHNQPNILFNAAGSPGKDITASSPVIGVTATPRLIAKSNSVINPSSTVIITNNRQFGSPSDLTSGHGDKLLENQLEANPVSNVPKNICQNDNSIFVSHMPHLKPFSSQQYIKSTPGFSSLCIKNPQIMSSDNVHQCETFAQQENNRGIREVLVKLHDQFESLNTKYEELQGKMEKDTDEKLATEMSCLEGELNAKEDEINAVVGLYKEVMALKEEMKVLQEKNSLVCISAEISEKPKNAYYPGIPLRLDRSYASKRGNNFVSARAPSASVRLAALLRQIQMFQKQLKSEFS